MLPASYLDCVLYDPTKPFIKKIEYLNVTLDPEFSGRPVIPKNVPDLYASLLRNIDSRVYNTTDHLPVCIEVANTDGSIDYFISISLDNSSRANMIREDGRSFSVMDRLDGICQLLRNIFERLNGNGVLFCSDACRSSFRGTVNNRQNEVLWTQLSKMMVEKLSDYNLKSIVDAPSNSDERSFGLGVFSFGAEVTRTIRIENVLPNFKSGCACVGVKSKNGPLVWSLYFPWVFEGEGTNSPSYHTMVNLLKLIKETPETACAFGNFTTIPGNMENAIKLAFDEYNTNMDLVLHRPPFPTFYASFFDTIDDINTN